MPVHIRRQNRRPADIFVSNKATAPGLRDMALDVAVTSVLSTGNLVLRATKTTPETVMENYGERKKRYLETEEQCKSAGIQFTPLIFESAGGGWGKPARSLLDSIANGIKLRGRPLDHHQGRDASSMVAQRISIVLQKELARATLRRESGLQCEVEQTSGGFLPPVPAGPE